MKLLAAALSLLAGAALSVEASGQLGRELQSAKLAAAKIPEASVEGNSEAGRRLALSPIFPVDMAQVIGDKRSTGVGIGDVNGDGAPDIVFAGAGAELNELFINRGNGTFPSTGIPLPGGKLYTTDVLMGDFNNDNHTDIFVSNAGRQGQQLLLHDGSANDNPYPTATPVPITGGPSDPRPSTDSRAAYAADINNDGNLDVLISGYGPESMVLLGNGDGTFPGIIYLDDGQSFTAYDIRAADLDNDGDIDIVVGYTQNGPPHPGQAQMYLNDGNLIPTFTKLPLPEYQQSLGVVLSDFNNDDLVDIVITNGKQFKNKLLVNNGKDPTTGYPTFTASDLPGNWDASSSHSVDAADMNGDGAIDIVISLSEHPPQLLLNNGTGGFHETDVYDLPEPTRSHHAVAVKIGDLNGDNKPDIVSAGGWSSSTTATTFRHVVHINNASTFPSSDPTTEQPTSAPTTVGPTGSPTTIGPTKSPTTAEPTGSPTTVGPTVGPTTARPTSTPWTIAFLGIDSDFSRSSEDELVLKYEIGKDKAYETFLYEENCASSITDISVGTTKSRQNINMTHDLLTLRYSFNKTAITNSIIWNPTSNKIEICQVVNLIIPESDGQQKMAIVEDIREVDIEFDLSVNYSVENDLGAGTIEDAAGNANVSSYVQACKCAAADNFTCDPIALVPNTQLYVCIKSVSSDVEIKKLVNMAAKQGSSIMNVIVNGLVNIASIADITYVKAENGVVVSTFVPTNIFNYSAGASINITGTIDMELVGSGRRVLADASDGNALNADGNSQESYQLKVDLQDELIVLEEGAWMDSSGAPFLEKAFSLLGVALLLVAGVW